MIYVKKLNVVKKIDESRLKVFETMGYRAAKAAKTPKPDKEPKPEPSHD